MTNLIFDTLHQEADEIVYRIAFSCQSKDKETGELTVEDDDIAYLLVDFFVDKLKKIAKNIVFYLSTTERSNFRYALAKTKGPNGLGYKAGRGERPYHYQTVRNYLISHYGAKEIEGYEADDALGINCISDKDVMSHIDKDLNMLPGWHYNYVSGEFYKIETGLGTLELCRKTPTLKLIGRGLFQFYAQLLTGDRTDNIPGIPKIGPKKAYNLLHECCDERSCFFVVATQYRAYYGDIFYSDILYEMASLLWIVRSDRIIGSDYLKNKEFLIAEVCHE